MRHDPLTDKNLLRGLRNGDNKCFTRVFTSLYPDLVIFSARITGSISIAEELVQDTFLKLWEDRESLLIHTSLRSYLLKSVQNRSFDWLKHQKTVNRYKNMILNRDLEFISETENYYLFSELKDQIEIAIQRLPDKIAEVFRLSRHEGLKYHEIASRLEVSVRTVEERMGKALQLLRENLKEYFPGN